MRTHQFPAGLGSVLGTGLPGGYVPGSHQSAPRNFMGLCVLDRLWRLWPGPTSN
jgi:hypothetical protein